MLGNREYKSDVFSMLMEDKERALQLYNAINGSHYDDPNLVEMKNLDGGISLSIRNDAAFIVDARLSIYEHQATVNPNMPLRSLIYFVTIIMEMLDRNELSKRSIYNRSLVKIPTPEFVVFYNGEEDQPEVQELKLSDAFEVQTDDPKLELKCTVYNINAGKNKKLLGDCQWLQDYMTFVNKVRELHAGRADHDLEADIDMAINYCIEHNVLRDFLTQNRREVTKNMTLDFTFDRRLELEREDARDDGLAEGMEKGLAEGMEKGQEAERLKLIKNMQSKGFTLDQIAMAVDIRPDEVERMLAE